MKIFFCSCLHQELGIFSGIHRRNRKFLCLFLSRKQHFLWGFLYGLLAFTRLGGKILYRSSDIEKLLDSCYREARTRPEEL